MQGDDGLDAKRALGFVEAIEWFGNVVAFRLVERDGRFGQRGSVGVWSRGPLWSKGGTGFPWGKRRHFLIRRVV